MDFREYDSWIHLANTVRKDYLSGKLTAKEFLWKVDVVQELDSYSVKLHPKLEV